MATSVIPPPSLSSFIHWKQNVEDTTKIIKEHLKDKKRKASNNVIAEIQTEKYLHDNKVNNEKKWPSH